MKFEVFWGIAVEDKAVNSRVVKVYIKDFLPFVDGKLADDDGVENFEVTNNKGATESLSMVTSVHTPCEWFSFTSNRTFPPDVVKGEQVLVLQYKDSNTYYWMSAGRDDHLRASEIHRQSVANRKAVGEGLDDTNTYYFEMDTKFNKRIRLILNNSDGELHSYGITIDGKNSFISLNDDIGNTVILESEIPRVKMSNSSGTFVDLNDKDIIMVAPRDIILTAGRQIVANAKNITNNAKVAIANKAPNLGLSSSNLTLKGDTVGIDVGGGACQIAGHARFTSVTATAYSTASPGATYPESTTTVSNGSGSSHKPTPNASGGSGNRHCAAEEQMVQMAQLITQCFSEIQSEIGQPSSHGGITPIAQASKMNKNTGE